MVFVCVCVCTHVWPSRRTLRAIIVFLCSYCFFGLNDVRACRSKCKTKCACICVPRGSDLGDFQMVAMARERGPRDEAVFRLSV